MLRIKYFEEFENNYPFLVIIGNKDAMNAAYRFFSTQKEAYLNNKLIAEFSQIYPLEQNSLYLSKEECVGIAEHFKNLSEADQPSHAYFDTQALGDNIEIIISYDEYEKLF